MADSGPNPGSIFIFNFDFGLKRSWVMGLGFRRVPCAVLVLGRLHTVPVLRHCGTPGPVCPGPGVLQWMKILGEPRVFIPDDAPGPGQTGPGVP